MSPQSIPCFLQYVLVLPVNWLYVPAHSSSEKPLQQENTCFYLQMVIGYVKSSFSLEKRVPSRVVYVVLLYSLSSTCTWICKGFSMNIMGKHAPLYKLVDYWEHRGSSYLKWGLDLPMILADRRTFGGRISLLSFLLVCQTCILALEIK